jgi:3-oxoacyl-[acyl-carrier-protein] synthase II
MRVVITGVGLTSPIGNSLKEFRHGLIEGKSGLSLHPVRHMGQHPMGLCHFDETLYQTKKARRRGTRAGSIALYCANEALKDAGLVIDEKISERTGVYIGITEHGNVETEEEVHQLYQNQLDIQLWSHNHNHRTVANNPAGEVTIGLKIRGPHYTIGGACAAGNLGPIQGAQMIALGEVDYALAGGVSESPATFGIFAAFKSQGALGHHEDPTMASRPLDRDRNGIAISEGGAIFLLESLDSALKRGAKIYGEIAGYHVNSDAHDLVLPYGPSQRRCMERALQKAQLNPSDIDIVGMHATGTPSGDVIECDALRSLFSESDKTYFNGLKGHIGHAMGASGSLALAGNLPSFEDGMLHPFRNIENLDPQCELPRLLRNKVEKKNDIKIIMNNSFGMVGINSVLIVKKFENHSN